RPLSGRTPAAADEVALTPRAASRLGTGVGDTIRLTGGQSFRGVATVEDPSNLRASVIVLRPGARPPAALHAASEPGSPMDSRWLVTTPGPVTWAQVKQLNTHGVVALSRYVLAHPPSAAEQYSELEWSSGGPTLAFAVLVG